MSTVYLAVQLSVGREVALKVMSPALNADPVFSERFQREATIVGQLTHSNIVSIYDIGRHHNLNYIAMDYLPGGSIHERMSTGLGLQEILRVVKEIAGALDHAHRKGYVHRDIKPENILFNEENTAILSDFGVAKTVSSGSQMTNAGTVVGTPHYMSPEQARGKPIDGRSDLYSLGVVFYEMLTGTVPYKAEEAVAIAIKHLTAPVPSLPSQYALFQPLLNKLLAKEPEDRFQCGRDIIAAIDGTQTHLAGHTIAYTTTTDSQALQILGLLKALTLTTYAAISGLMWRATKWTVGWRWKKAKGFYHRSTLHNTDAGHNTNRTTLVATRFNEAVMVTRKGLNYRKQAALATLMLILVWLAGSSLLHKLPSPVLETLPQPLVAATDVTHGQLQRLFNRLFQETAPESEPVIAPAAEIAETIAQTAAASEQPAAGENSGKTENKATTDRHVSADAGTEQTPVPVADIPMLVPDTPANTPTAVAPAHFELVVTTRPSSARVRIMNIAEKYYPGIPLEPGVYQLAVDAHGYHTQSRKVEITDTAVQLNVSLRKAPVPGTTFYNTLKSGSKGPAMVIVPAGTFTMGNKHHSDTAPERRVNIDKAFAVSRYEITFADYAKYAKARNMPLPKTNGWGKGSRPVINVSWQDANDYVAWLAASTGKKYRLLTEAEWEYVARANTDGDYWWGTENPAGKANCRRDCESNYTTFFSLKTAPVGSYKANPFRLFDTSGNVAEWVQDCHQGHYLGAPRDGSAAQQVPCTEYSVRGGSIKTAAKSLRNYSRDKRPGDFKSSYIGFRVAVDLY